MKNARQPVRSGTFTIVITCVMLLLAVLSLLSLTTARADQALAKRQLQFAQQNALSERVGQEWLSAMDDYLRAGGSLPYDTEQAGDTYSVSRMFAQNEYLDITATADSEGRLTVTKWDIRVTSEAAELYIPDGVTMETENEDGTYDILPDTEVTGTGLA